MYSNKTNVSILTSILAEQGVEHVVVCPGSRNAPLVHNFSECGSMKCHPVTDERSAGFMALGLALQSGGRPAAVCVTSGSALLNLMPAVAEAAYQHCRFIVISADRPAQWIDQLDGQTLPQHGALEPYVAKSVSLPEPTDDESRWYCNRLVNEAYIAMQRTNRPVHINVPISEPLFDFKAKELEQERIVSYVDWSSDFNKETISLYQRKARRPMVIMGQVPLGIIPDDYTQELEEKAVVLYDQLSIDDMPCYLTDQMLYAMEGKDKALMPDFVVYFGGNTVSKRLRQFMRRLPQACHVVMVDAEGELKDVGMNADFLIHGQTDQVVKDIYMTWLYDYEPNSKYINAWNNLRDKVEERHEQYKPGYSSMLAVKLFEEDIKSECVYYANSMAVRLGCIYARHYIFCNRGVNGIEGSLSTAAGAALAAKDISDENIYCVTGDLSFFYDENALLQKQLTGNLRILLLNNHGGGIFATLNGLEASPASHELIAASHDISAEGICRQCGLAYKKATTEAGLYGGIGWLRNEKSDRPVVLEVVTNADDDKRAYEEYFAMLK